MSRKSLIHVGVGAFLLCWVLLLGLPCIISDCPLSSLTRLSEDGPTNLLILMALFAVVSAAAAFVADAAYRFLRTTRYFRPRLGEVLVQSGYITREQLDKALAIQRLRIGEFLVYFGIITPEQLDHALGLQKEQGQKRLGEIVKDLGYASTHDVEWAAGQVHGKLGKILLHLQLLDEEALKEALGRLWYIQRKCL